jgi:hypothetical protein
MYDMLDGRSDCFLVFTLVATPTSFLAAGSIDLALVLAWELGFTITEEIDVLSIVDFSSSVFAAATLYETKLGLPPLDLYWLVTSIESCYSFAFLFASSDLAYPAAEGAPSNDLPDIRLSTSPTD